MAVTCCQNLTNMELCRVLALHVKTLWCIHMKTQRQAVSCLSPARSLQACLCWPCNLHTPLWAVIVPPYAGLLQSISFPWFSIYAHRLFYSCPGSLFKFVDNWLYIADNDFFLLRSLSFFDILQWSRKQLCASVSWGNQNKFDWLCLGWHSRTAEDNCMKLNVSQLLFSLCRWAPSESFSRGRQCLDVFWGLIQNECSPFWTSIALLRALIFSL